MLLSCSVIGDAGDRMEVAAGTQRADAQHALAAIQRKMDKSQPHPDSEFRSGTLRLTAQVGAGEAVSYV